MKGNASFILLGAMILLSALLIGNGITGFVVMDPGIKEVCSAENPCQEPKVCCSFYEDSKGVCATPDTCDDITEITKSQTLSNNELQNILNKRSSTESPIDKEEKLEGSYTTQIMFGALLLIIAILNVLLYVENRQESKKKSS